MMKLLLLLAASIPLFAQQCSYSYSPIPTQPLNIAATASTNTITITAPDGCTWSYATNDTWITFPAPNLQGSGAGSFTWQAAANPFSSSRTGHIVVSNPTFGSTVYTVVQALPVCTLALSPGAGTSAVGGTTGTFQAQTNCVWVAGSNVTWMGVTAPGTGTLTGTVGYTVAPNACADPRTGTLTVYAGSTSVSQNFTMVQNGSPNNLVLTPAGLPSVPPIAADGTITVSTGAGCGWFAYSDVSWMSVTGATTGSGAGSVSYHIIANTSVARSGNIHVGSILFPVTQSPAPSAVVQLNSVLNGGSYAQGAVSPGEVVAAFGTNMGPVPGISAPQGSFPKTLGNVQLLFDGVPAPLLYVSATQVNAVAPYAITGTTQVQVQYQSLPSNALTLNVQPATPGLLTLDRSGIGPGAILNQDFSVNGAANPAARGSALMIYCVGGGVTNPPSTDGALTATPVPPALPPILTQPVFVTIGNQDAKVLYSGAVAGSIAGLTQINAVIPAGVTPGSNVPIVIRIGGVQSQTSVTVAIQ
jgi:trimeric autotransporter adhesin